MLEEFNSIYEHVRNGKSHYLLRNEMYQNHVCCVLSKQAG